MPDRVGIADAYIHLRPNEAEEYFFEEGCYILELCNSAADPALSIARIRLPAGHKTRTHRLHQTSERYVILAGSGEARIGDAPPLRVVAGDVVVIAPGVDQMITSSNASDLLFLAMCTPRFERHNYEDREPAD